VSLRRVLLLPILLITVLAGLAIYTAVSHSAALRTSQRDVAHTHQVIEAAQSLFSTAQDAEIGQRGYLLTNDPAYLAPWRESSRRLPGDMERLRNLVADNPGQIARVARLEEILRHRLALIDTTLAAMRRGEPQVARDVMISGRGKAEMDRARTQIATIIAEEQALLLRRQARAAAEDRKSVILAISVGGLALAGLAASLLVMALGNRDLRRALARRDAAESGRREADALVRAVFENIPDYLYTFEVTPDGRFLVGDFNPALAKLLGGDMTPYRGRDVMDAFPVMGPRLTELYRRVIETGRATSLRDSAEVPGVGVITWESMLAPVFDDAGKPTRIVGSSRDITEREQAEEKLRRSQRMESIGQLTGGVAHDFNNLLQVIRANLEMIERAVKDEKTLSRIANATHAADRAADLTRQLLAFARRQPLEPEVVNPGRLVQAMAEMLRRTLGERIEVETVIAGGLWNTIADPAQVESALLNLALNARDAMPDGGRLTVELANAALDDRYASRDSEIAPGQYVMLAVSDTGQGMSRETVARVFEPFFTTKVEGRGTGLGLSMVHGFVKQSRGHIQIYSEPGQGTTVKIYLPRTRKAEAPTRPEAMAGGRGETILVVEDEAAVREAACAMLTDLGYHCIPTDGPDAALEVLRGDGAIDLLFTDVVMPGAMRTPAFVALAGELRPGLPVLYTSGYTENAIVHHGRLDEGVALLSKPYGKTDLARKVAAALVDGRQAVLVVEDEALVRAAALDMVGDLGFAVLEAGDGPEALAILESGARVDILFTDIGLPGLRGDELARRARTLRPELRIILASGYSDHPAVDGLEDAMALDKPYDSSALAKALGRARAG
jgi:PAS domain S-box-containing protein